MWEKPAECHVCIKSRSGVYCHRSTDEALFLDAACLQLRSCTYGICVCLGGWWVFGLWPSVHNSWQTGAAAPEQKAPPPSSYICTKTRTNRSSVPSRWVRLRRQGNRTLCGLTCSWTSEISRPKGLHTMEHSFNLCSHKMGGVRLSVSTLMEMTGTLPDSMFCCHLFTQSAGQDFPSFQLHKFNCDFKVSRVKACKDIWWKSWPALNRFLCLWLQRLKVFCVNDSSKKVLWNRRAKIKTRPLSECLEIKGVNGDSVYQFNSVQFYWLNYCSVE